MRCTRAADLIADYRASLPDARVAPTAGREGASRALGGALPDEPDAAPDGDRRAGRQSAEPGPDVLGRPTVLRLRHGGSLDAPLIADVLTTGWDQLAFNEASSPAAIAVRGRGRRLAQGAAPPARLGVGRVRHGHAGGEHDRPRRGALVGTPPCAGGTSAATGSSAPRFGSSSGPSVTRRSTAASACSASARPRSRRCRRWPTARWTPTRSVACSKRIRHRPTIVCAQAGNVNTGACDDLTRRCRRRARAGAWLHVDGAFGLWAAASERTRHLVEGIELADSWSCDGHKWLNVPYDSGYAICAHQDVHATAMAYTAAYLTGQVAGREFGGGDFVPESSRRARGLRPGPRSARWDGPGWPTSSTAAVRWRGGSRRAWTRSRASRS